MSRLMRFWHFNPFKPSVLFVGHWQTVQNQIRRRKMRHLIKFSTVAYRCLLKFEWKWKIPPNNSRIGNGLVQLIRKGKYIQHKWVNHICKQHRFRQACTNMWSLESFHCSYAQSTCMGVDEDWLKFRPLVLLNTPTRILNSLHAGYFFLILCCMLIFFQNQFFRNILSGISFLSNSLDPDQAWCFVGLDLGPNSLQRLSADDKIHRWQAKS